MKMASLNMYLTSALAIILGTLLVTNAQPDVPVLLLQSRNTLEHGLSQSALSKMNVDDFADVLMRRLQHNPVVVLFSEEDLSVEDFSRQGSGTSPFPALQSIKGDVRLEFIPAVQAPEKALNRLSKLGYKWEEISGVALPEAGKKILSFNLGDSKPGEDRSAMLLRHDKFITTMVKRMVSEYGNVLALYTGRKSWWQEHEAGSSRVRREAEPTSPSSSSCGTVLKSAGSADQMMLYTSECPLLIVNNTSHRLTYGVATTADTRKDSHRLIVRYKLDDSSEKGTVRFRFNFTKDGYWQLTQAEYEGSNGGPEILESKSNIRAPNNSSYCCGNEAVFQNADASVTLKLKNIQVQPGVQREVFAPCSNCIGFFTIPIWSGLFVTFILLFIVAWGIDMMMNIRTMDRFDDPKGKPLVFSAQE